ncbi:MAG: glycosyltransferase [Alphaproteobacteria bacterium]|nr:glycosyltransferase [Alphaproteobacteria bacterium]
MKIANLMFACGRGGVEQAFLDYCEALRLRGHDVTGFVHPDAWAAGRAQAMGISTVAVRNFGMYDPLAARRLRPHLQELKPDAVIIHGKRALTLASRALDKTTPLISVVHNYWQPRTRRLSAIFCVSRDLLEHMARQGMPRPRLFHIPNMIHCERPFAPPAWHRPPIVGAMGRMVEKKGFDVFLRALKILVQEGCAFDAVLAGDGPERSKLEELSRKLGLADRVRFPGWVEDRESFYRAIDLFCLPSRHEPFGIVLLEAMAHGVPVVSTDSEGPGEIIASADIAVMAKKDDAEALAAGLRLAMSDERASRERAGRAYGHVRASYSLAAVAERIEAALLIVVQPEA